MTTERKIKEAWIVTRRPYAGKSGVWYLCPARFGGKNRRWGWGHEEADAHRFTDQKEAERTAKRYGGTVRLIRWFEEEGAEQ